MFYNDAYPVQGPRATRGRGLLSKRHSLWGCVEKIMVNPRFGQVKIVVIGKASSCESDPQSSGLWKKLPKWNLISAMQYEVSEGGSLQCAWHHGKRID